MDFAAARRNMIDGQILPNRVSDSLVMEAFEGIPRERFVPDALRSVAYADEDLLLGQGRCLLEPSVLARLLQAAAIEDSETVLVVAGATGYTAAVVSRLAQSVVLLEAHAGFAATARATLAELEFSAVTVVEGPLTEGCVEHGPYDVILVDGAIEHAPPALMAQLGDGGRLVAVVQTGVQGVATVFRKYGASVGEVPVFDANVPKLAEFVAPSQFVF